MSESWNVFILFYFFFKCGCICFTGTFSLIVIRRHQMLLAFPPSPWSLFFFFFPPVSSVQKQGVNTNIVYFECIFVTGWLWCAYCLTTRRCFVCSDCNGSAHQNWNKLFLYECVCVESVLSNIWKAKTFFLISGPQVHHQNFVYSACEKIEQSGTSCRHVTKPSNPLWPALNAPTEHLLLDLHFLS